MTTKRKAKTDSTPVATGWAALETSRLVKADWNYKLEDAELSAKLRENLQRNGQIESLLVRQFPADEMAARVAAGLDPHALEVVNGNHRLEPLHQLYGKAMCFNLGPVSRASAARHAIELNETRFETDYARMSGLLADMGRDGATLADLARTLPFSDDQLRHYVELSGFQWDQVVPPTVDDVEAAGAGDDSGVQGRRDTKVHHITATAANFETIGRAIEVLRTREQDPDITEGRALELICADYMAGPG